MFFEIAVCHVTFSGKEPLFEELVVVCSNIIRQQKHILDAGQLFPSSCVWNDRPSFHRKILKGERSFFSTFGHLYLLKMKSRKIILNIAR